jgi:hypothetical protein
MTKRFLPILFVAALLTGCASTFTNLSAQRQVRNPSNLYPVGVKFDSKQQSLRWESIKPSVIVGREQFPLRQTKLMSNRWEGLIPVPANAGEISYFYKFDYQYNDFGKPPSTESASSANFTLKILER